MGREVFQCSLWHYILGKKILLVSHIVELHLHILEWYHTPKSDF
jgi:hypothetical protein